MAAITSNVEKVGNDFFVNFENHHDKLFKDSFKLHALCIIVNDSLDLIEINNEFEKYTYNELTISKSMKIVPS